MKRSTTRWDMGGGCLSSKGHCLGNQHGAYESKRAAEVIVVLQVLGISGRVQQEVFSLSGEYRGDDVQENALTQHTLH